jgi:hypothetical protein
MFSEELKAFRRLGFRHVRICPGVIRSGRKTYSLQRHTNNVDLAAITSAQLRLGDCVGAYDVERAGAVDEHRIANCSRAQVSSNTSIYSPARIVYEQLHRSVLTS